MHPKTLAKIYGPGPLAALTQRKNAVPVKRKTAKTTFGAASMYAPVKRRAGLGA
jgi:hypothetical protein